MVKAELGITAQERAGKAFRRAPLCTDCRKKTDRQKKRLTVTGVLPMLAVVGRSWLSWIEQQATNLCVGSSNLSGRTNKEIRDSAGCLPPGSFFLPTGREP